MSNISVDLRHFSWDCATDATFAKGVSSSVEVLLERELKTPAGENSGDEGRRYDRVEGGRRGEGRGVHLRLRDSLRLRPPVLEPDLDLSLRDVQAGCELRPLGDAEVGLLLVLLLQLAQLLGGERRPWLPVRSVLPQGALEGEEGRRWGGGGGGGEAVEKEGRHVRVERGRGGR